MAQTYEPIATQNFTTSGAITFSSIPSTYTHLRIVFVGNTTNGGGNPSVVLNSFSDYSALYHELVNTSIGTSTYTTARTNVLVNWTGGVQSSGYTTQWIFDIFNYRSSGLKNGLMYFYSPGPNTQQMVSQGTWIANDGSAAVTSVTVNSSYTVGTFSGRFTLYGIKAA